MSDFKQSKRSRSRSRSSTRNVQLSVPRTLFRRRGRGQTNFNPNQIYRYKQSVSGQGLTLVSSALTTYNTRAAYIPQISTETSYAFAFCLNDVDQVSTFTSLYDQYRIKKIRIHFRPSVNNQVTLATSTTVAVLPVGNVYTAVDVDDNTAGASSVLRQYQTCRVQSVMNSSVITRTFKPAIAMTMYNTAVTSGYGASKPGQWIDVAYPSVPHYGVKIAIDPANATGAAASTAQIYEVDCEFWLEFRNVR